MQEILQNIMHYCKNTLAHPCLGFYETQPVWPSCPDGRFCNFQRDRDSVKSLQEFREIILIYATAEISHAQANPNGIFAGE